MMARRLRYVGFIAAYVFLLAFMLLHSSAAQASGSPGPSATPTVAPSVTLSPTPSSTATPSPSPTPTPSSAPLLNISGTGTLWFIGLIVAGVALLGLGVIAADAGRASKWRNNVTEGISAGKYSGASPETLLALIREPRGVRGVTRALIALLVIVLATLALAVTIISVAPDAPDLRKTIVTSLLTILATVAGFYYGARTAQTAAGDAAAAASAQSSPEQSSKPTITVLKNNKGAGGTPIDIIGSGLHDTAAVLFGGVSGSALTVHDDSTLTVTPPAQPSGTVVPVIIITSSSRSAAGPEAKFTYE